MSAYSLLRDPRTLKLSDDGFVLSPVARSNIAVPIDVVVLVETCDEATCKTVVSLANVHYSINIMFVCGDNGVYDPIANLLTRYKHTLPTFSVFRPARKLTVVEGMEVGLQNGVGTFICVLHAGDMMHMFTFERIAAMIGDADVDCCTARRFTINAAGWSHSSRYRKPVWRANYVIKHGGFTACSGRTIHDVEEVMISRVVKERRIDVDDVLFFC